MFIVSDNDLENRMEQMMLTQLTLKHFEHNTDAKIMHGSHCEYVGKKLICGKIKNA